jgi:hypothetical protein
MVVVHHRAYHQLRARSHSCAQRERYTSRLGIYRCPTDGSHHITLCKSTPKY